MSLGGALLCIVSYIGLSSFLETELVSPIKGDTYSHWGDNGKYSTLTHEILEAIYDLEKSQIDGLDKPISYFTRYYRIQEDEPRILRAHFYKQGEVRFLGYEFKERTVSEFLYNYPNQHLLKKLSFVENAYFYRPTGRVQDLYDDCHNGSQCNSISIYYNLDSKKIIGYRGIILRRTVLDKPTKPEVPPYPKTKG